MTRIAPQIMVLGWLLLGCGVQGSTVREAHQIELGRIYLDQVTSGTDDDADWHQIDLDTPGWLLVLVEPEVRTNAVGSIDVFDDQGSLVGTEKLKQEGGNLVIDSKRSVRFFVRIQVSSGVLRYKLRVSTVDAESCCAHPAHNPAGLHDSSPSLATSSCLGDLTFVGLSR